MHSGRLIRRLADRFGSRIVDQETGCLLGRAFLLSWRGRVWVVGYTGLKPLRPVATSDRWLNYWKLTLGFAAPVEPDFEGGEKR